MYGSHQKELSGGEAQTTNNRMELTGVIAALEALKEPCVVELFSPLDCSLRRWSAYPSPFCFSTTTARSGGAAGNQFNNRCDQLAVAESQKYK